MLGSLKPGTVINAKPGDDLQQLLDGAASGDEIVLADGNYTWVGSPPCVRAPCDTMLSIVNKDITIRAQHPGQAVLTHTKAAAPHQHCVLYVVPPPLSARLSVLCAAPGPCCFGSGPNSLSVTGVWHHARYTDGLAVRLYLVAAKRIKNVTLCEKQVVLVEIALGVVGGRRGTTPVRDGNATREI